MKASHLVERLQTLILMYGDLDVIESPQPCIHGWSYLPIFSAVPLIVQGRYEYFVVQGDHDVKH